jgi:hypothetical protein
MHHHHQARLGDVMDTNDILRSGVFRPPASPGLSLRFGTCVTAAASGWAVICIDGDEATSQENMRVTQSCLCSQGERVIVALIGHTRIGLLRMAANTA